MGSQPASPGTGARALVLLVAFLAGACTMTIELAAVRLLSPWYGTSSAVWTNVIGVVLLALSVGYLVGARASRSTRPARVLARTLLLAALVAGLLPFVAARVAEWFLPTGLALEEAGDLVRWGSLASSVCLFLPPAALLGCVAPLCAELIERRGGGSAGRAGGVVLCVSTLGSLLGTFGTTYATVPHLGVARTFAAASVVLAALALLVTFGSRDAPLRERSARALLALVVLGGAIVVSSARAGPGARDDVVTLEARDSALQSVRVVETLGEPPRLRYLQVNESFDSFQSVWQAPKGLLPDGYYYNHFAFPLAWTRAPREFRVVVAGFGAGTVWRVLDGTKPPGCVVSMIGAEIDPVVTELAARHMDLPRSDPQCRVFAPLDGRCVLRGLREPVDLIVVDAYANQMEIPPHLASAEYFRECRAHLREDGWLAANVGGFGLQDPVVEAVAATLATAFERRVLALRVPFSRNVTLFVRRRAEPPEPHSKGWFTGQPALDRHLSAAAVPGGWRWFDGSEAPTLTDDRNPIQELQRRSIEDAAQRSAP